MQELLSRERLGAAEVAAGGVARRAAAEVAVGAGERRARAQLRAQVGRLERELARLTAAGFPFAQVDYRVAATASAPRLLDLGALERVRDELADRISEARRTLAARAELEARNRELLRALVAAPERHRGLQISRADVGEPGCGGWRSAPRYGLIGMLMGWWQVKVSSGCPLAGRLAAVER